MTWPFGALTYSIDYVCVEGVSFPFSFQFCTRLRHTILTSTWIFLRLVPLIFSLGLLIAETVSSIFHLAMAMKTISFATPSLLGREDGRELLRNLRYELVLAVCSLRGGAYISCDGIAHEPNENPDFRHSPQPSRN